MDRIADFVEFLVSSPSSFHAAAEVSRCLRHTGFRLHTAQEQWDASPGGHVMVHDGAVVAWYVPDGVTPKDGFRVVGAHTDSPGFKLKPKADFFSCGWHQAAVEVYGGPILDSWFDRELALAGRLVLANGSSLLVCTPPLLRIPRLAIHLDRQESFTPDRQRDVQPLCSVAEDSEPSLLQSVTATAGTTPDSVLAHDLITVDTQEPGLFGTARDLLAAGRLDNLTSVYAAMIAFEQAAHHEIQSTTSDEAGEARSTSPKSILVFAAFDHEEVGSSTATGAAGPLLERTLRRIATALGADEEQYCQMIERSTCVSADAAHAVHPNHSEKHDPQHQPQVNAGPVLKINANQRYASDARAVAFWRASCRRAGVPEQVFVGNNGVPCGSTIGPITATRLGIPTVDVGLALLSMHSAREMCGVRDVDYLCRALTAYLVS